METNDNSTSRANPRLKDRFHVFARSTSDAMGSPWAFVTAILVVVIWGLTGPAFGYSDTWQLVINTGTTIITFLMVFLIQSTQNRDARAVHLKLDELLHAVSSARNELVDLEKLSEEELDKLSLQFTAIREKAKVHVVIAKKGSDEQGKM
ncbi:MAG: hypothetical protein JWO08_1632 [Verrucomicrobiaceae bacterium]|nr:hypothetical protein [Verrucomicrobiaceae bacterium]